MLVLMVVLAIPRTAARGRRSPPLRRRHELLPNVQLWILWKEDLNDGHLVWYQIARGNGLVVLDVLLRVDQDGGRFFADRVIIGPFRQDRLGRIAQINFDPLIGWEIERDGALAQVRYDQLDLQLAHL